MYCGLGRERGMVRTVTTHRTRCDSSRSTNSLTGRVEWQIVKNGNAMFPVRSVIHSALREILGVKQVTCTTQVIQVLPNLDLFILLGNHRELQDSPAIGMLQNRAAQVVHV